MTSLYKDANECLLAGLDADAMRACLNASQEFAPEKVKSAESFRAAFMAEWFDKELESGLSLPFPFPWKVRNSELTVWTGIEKSGKTTLLQFVLAGLLHQGERALIASFELKAAKNLKKFSRQVYGGLIRNPKLEDKCLNEEQRQNYLAQAKLDAHATFDWIAPRLWVYDHTGIGDWRQLCEDIRWARRRYGITQIVVDNFMRLGISKDDYAQQADAITFFAGLAMDLDCHIHMVVHQNKGEGKKETRGKRSVSGAFEIIANAHNIVEVTRDEGKGEKVSDLWDKLKNDLINRERFEDEKRQLDLVPDGKFILHAQRDGEQQNASKYLWFLWESQQYCDAPPGHKDHTVIKFMQNAPPVEPLVEQEFPDV